MVASNEESIATEGHLKYAGKLNSLCQGRNCVEIFHKLICCQLEDFDRTINPLHASNNEEWWLQEYISNMSSRDSWQLDVLSEQFLLPQLDPDDVWLILILILVLILIPKT